MSEASPRTFSASFIDLDGLLQAGLRGRVLKSPRERSAFSIDRLLRLAQELHVVGRTCRSAGAGLAADHLPGAVDDLFLKLGQLVGLPGVAPALLSCSFSAEPLGGLLALAEDLLEVADLGEVHIALGAPWLAVGSEVLGPDEIGHELVRRGLERLEVDQMLG